MNQISGKKILKPNEIPKTLLKDCMEAAVKELYSKDLYLICNKPDLYNGDEYHVSERGIVFRLGIYFEKYLYNYKFFHGYNLDAEYNRNMYDVKTLSVLGIVKAVCPDLIIHQRGNNNFNLIVIEVKTWWNNCEKDISYDIEKLEKFISLNEIYKYEYGLSLIFKQTQVEYNWISQNKEKCCKYSITYN